ncbi:uncharacterized protein LOC121771410 [Salvia splendens]|uniref:uncharacterized protein LOC121771410 n=1 Tax=Salvia splendens TaxID=180675 RepID=UPI001C25FCDA|nr:uncharacterized protein LOC121771410 [Salvia splendens]
MAASISEIGLAIFEAVADGDLKQLRGEVFFEMSDSNSTFNLAAIRKKVYDGWEFRKICDEYCDFSTGQTVLHHAAGNGHFKICKFLIEDVKVHIDASTYKSSFSSHILINSI